MPKTRFTIYDAMENAGVFQSNPANPGARDADGNALYTGPVEYPKMLYHPDGEEKIIVPAEMVLRAGNYVPVGEQRELIHQIVNSRTEEDEALATGWHDHPAKAVEARVKELIKNNTFSEKEEKALLAKIPKLAPSVNRIAELEAEIARLMQARKDQAVVDPKANKIDDEEAA